MRDTACFSMYSDISNRTIASSLPNIASARARASSVFPTPVGPRKIKEPIGRLGFLSPALALLTARATASTAFSCPTTRWCMTDSRLTRRSLSSSASLLTGTPVQSATMAATSTSVMELACRVRLFIQSLRRFSISSFRVCSSSLKRAAFSYSWALIASSFSCSISATFCSISFISSGRT